ncbi:MAG: hypothetical protein PHF25_01345 [Candidatus Margulisbacteria bacterium]|nr:hypothetical protein [Candidatus Margulisiibacteriota bacterium]
MNDLELISVVKEYIANVELINRKNSSLDLFSLEDILNRELSIDLFVVALEEKINFLLDQPRIVEVLVAG